jgi:hypothetical protein
MPRNGQTAVIRAYGMVRRHTEVTLLRGEPAGNHDPAKSTLRYDTDAVGIT